MRAAFITCIVAGAAHTALAWAPSDARYNHRRLASTMKLGQKNKEPVATSWFASWNAKDFPLSDISWPKYTNIGYSFGQTTPDINFVNISDPDVFKDFVSTAHANNCSASLTLGGWAGSQYFSTAVATAQNRTAFVKTLSTLVHEHQLDGLDFDWEYPNAGGIGCNTKSPNDTANFLEFLTELRTALPDTTLTAAAAIVPFNSPDGTPLPDVSGFASVLDYVAIMNYDVWGPWSNTVGPNAPLNDTCAADPSEKVGSAVSAVHAWTAAGIPADQLVLGVAAYGHSYVVAPSAAISSSSKALVPYPAFDKSAHPHGDAWDTIVPYDVCGNPEVFGGNWNFWGLIKGGFLNQNGTVNSAEGIMYRYDECSQTPYVYNQTSKIMVSYDDATSFAAKGHFIKNLGLRGFAMWQTGGDYHDILLDSIRSAADFPKVGDNEEDCEEDY